jgi:hypothetical protein
LRLEMSCAVMRRAAAVAVTTMVVSGAVARAQAPPRPEAPLRAEAPARHLESRRLRAGAVYVGTVTGVRRLGSLDGLTADMQGRMEAAVQVAKLLRGPAGVPPGEVALRFDSRAPEAEGDGYYTLAPGETVLVFADQLSEPAYPREVFHGAPEALTAEVKTLRDALLAMDADVMRLNSVTPSARATQVRLYDQALVALSRLPATR